MKYEKKLKNENNRRGVLLDSLNCLNTEELRRNRDSQAMDVCLVAIILVACDQVSKVKIGRLLYS